MITTYRERNLQMNSTTTTLSRYIHLQLALFPYECDIYNPYINLPAATYFLALRLRLKGTLGQPVIREMLQSLSRYHYAN